MLKRETCLLQLKINASRTRGSSGQEVSAARAEGQCLRDARGQGRLPSQRCRQTPRDATERPAHPATQRAVKIERNTPERYTQRPREPSHGGGQAVSRRGARSKLRPSRWGTADQGSVRPERPAPGDGGLRSEASVETPGVPARTGGRWWGSETPGAGCPPSQPLLLQEGGPLPGPETGLLSNTWK